MGTENQFQLRTSYKLSDASKSHLPQRLLIPFINDSMFSDRYMLQKLKRLDVKLDVPGH